MFSLLFAGKANTSASVSSYLSHFTNSDDLKYNNIRDLLIATQGFLAATSPNTLQSRNANYQPENAKNILHNLEISFDPVIADKPTEKLICDALELCKSVVAERLQLLEANGDKVFDSYKSDGDCVRLKEMLADSSKKLRI